MGRISIRAALISWLCLSLLVLGSVSAQEVENETIQLDVKAGLDGFYKGEFWVPVDITVSNDGPLVEGRLQITIGSNTTRNEVVYSHPLSLPSQSNKRQTIYVYLPNLVSNVTVDLIDGAERMVASRNSNDLDRQSLEELLYVVVSDEPSELGLLENVEGQRSDASVAFLRADDLPEQVNAWNAVDVIVFHNIDSGRLTAEQLDSLGTWIGGGGQMVVTGGPDWLRTTSGLTSFLPVSVEGIIALDSLIALEDFAGENFRDPGPYLVANSQLLNGEILLHQDGLPILTRQQRGRGAVYFLALDPNLAPLKDWDGHERIWEEIASFAPNLPTWAIGAKNSYAAANAVSSLPSLTLPSTLQLFVFLLTYVAVVGPVNYFVLNRLRRREMAWVTIPGLVLIFTLIAYLLGFQLKGNDTILNQMSIAFGGVDSEKLRVQTLLGLYSPRRATFEVVMPEKVVARPFNRDFGSLAGSGNIDEVQQDADLTISGLRVDVSGIETLVADSYQPAPLIDGRAMLVLVDDEFSLEVSVQNNGERKLEDAVILVGSTALTLGDIDPGSLSSQSYKISSPVSSPSPSGAPGTVFVPPAPSSSPLSTNYPALLGTANYFNDRDSYPRWQLLESISPQFGPADSYYPGDVATLIAWSDEGQIEVDLNASNVKELATTLYFIELPLEQRLSEQREIKIPKPLLTWEVLAENGIYSPRIDDLYLPPGWIEFEYKPWPEFQTMDVTDLAVIISAPSTSPSQPAPKVQLWDWNAETWTVLEESSWQPGKVEEIGRHVGPGNAVRIRLQNDSLAGIQVKEVYPLLSGTLR